MGKFRCKTVIAFALGHGHGSGNCCIFVRFIIGIYGNSVCGIGHNFIDFTVNDHGIIGYSRIIDGKVTILDGSGINYYRFFCDVVKDHIGKDQIIGCCKFAAYGKCSGTYGHAFRKDIAIHCDCGTTLDNGIFFNGKIAGKIKSGNGIFTGSDHNTSAFGIGNGSSQSAFPADGDLSGIFHIPGEGGSINGNSTIVFQITVTKIKSTAVYSFNSTIVVNCGSQCTVNSTEITRFSKFQCTIVQFHCTVYTIAENSGIGGDLTAILHCYIGTGYIDPVGRIESAAKGEAGSVDGQSTTIHIKFAGSGCIVVTGKFDILITSVIIGVGDIHRTINGQFTVGVLETGIIDIEYPVFCNKGFCFQINIIATDSQIAFDIQLIRTVGIKASGICAIIVLFGIPNNICTFFDIDTG